MRELQKKIKHLENCISLEKENLCTESFVLKDRIKQKPVLFAVGASGLVLGYWLWHKHRLVATASNNVNSQPSLLSSFSQHLPSILKFILPKLIA
jgi:hypothetical protein